jgi:hypothetical protein
MPAVSFPTFARSEKFSTFFDGYSRCLGLRATAQSLALEVPTGSIYFLDRAWSCGAGGIKWCGE